MRPGSILALALALSLLAGIVRGEDAQPRQAGSLSVGAGPFNIGHAHPSGGVGLEYRFDSRAWKPGASGRFSMIPALGVTGTSRNALFAYAGLRSHLGIGQRWRLTPGFSIGAYVRNGDIDLGGPCEFRSSLALSRALHRGPRIGLELYHISNARLYARNPGINALVLVQTF